MKELDVRNIPVDNPAWDLLDKKAHEGIRLGEIVTFMAGSGVGRSVFKEHIEENNDEM
jgi:ABC-type uncharacterized transport system YnjBCD ATPase subunit